MICPVICNVLLKIYGHISHTASHTHLTTKNFLLMFSFTSHIILHGAVGLKCSHLSTNFFSICFFKRILPSHLSNFFTGWGGGVFTSPNEFVCFLRMLNFFEKVKYDRSCDFYSEVIQFFINFLKKIYKFFSFIISSENLCDYFWKRF